MSKNDTKFEWDATESAPKHYPMEIIQGTFLYHGEAERGLYIPSGGTLRSGWGHPISSHVVGEQYKPLPDRLQIIFFSNAEKQFYKGEFELPYDKILALFRDGIANPRVFPNGETRPMYSRIMAGIAPGGGGCGVGDWPEIYRSFFWPSGENRTRSRPGVCVAF